MASSVTPNAADYLVRVNAVGSLTGVRRRNIPARHREDAVDYVVTAGVQPPAGAAALDALQREGVAAVLDRQLELVEGVAGPGEVDVDLLDYRITVQADRASVELVVDAPSLDVAEQAAATVLAELVSEAEPLLGWTVADSEVRITEDEFNESLAAAEALGEPMGLAGDGASLEAEVEDAMSGVRGAAAAEPGLDPEHWRAKLAELASQLAAFGPAAFEPAEQAPGAPVANGHASGLHEEGEGPGDEALLAAGALIHAVRVITDEIFYDEMALAVNNANVDEAADLLVLDELPSCYYRRYDARFARAFLLASAAVATRLTEPEWVPPRCVAEALALRLIIREARALLADAQLVDWDAGEPLFSAFADLAFADATYERLYDVETTLPAAQQPRTDDEAKVEDKLRAGGLAFEQWFRLSAGGGAEPTGSLHPYLQLL